MQDPNVPVVVRRGIPLDPNQENIVSVTAYNGAGLFAAEPFVIKVDRFGVSASPRPKMYVLGIAVDDYQADSGLTRLQFAAKDVKALAAAFKISGESGGYETVDIVPPLIDKEAVREKIDETFRRIRPLVKPWDTFVLILAGHGRSVAGHGYFYYPHNTKLGGGRNVLTDGIGADQWRDWLSMVETTKRLLIIDTCESADAIAIVRGNSIERESAIDRIREAVGHSVITASRQIAYEGSAYGHGILSYAVLGALGTPPPDHGIIDVKRLDQYVVAEVPKLSVRLSGVEQLPYNKIVGNFPVGRSQSTILRPAPLVCSTNQTEYVFKRRERIWKYPALDADVHRVEDEGYTITVADFVGDWAKICREGIAIGYVPSGALLKRR